MEITWWGTAAFRIRTGQDLFLIDPFVSRNPQARPGQPIRPDDIREGTRIFITHGHFDHIMDVPIIAGNTGAVVYCDETVAQTLVRDGLDSKQLKVVTAHGQVFDCGGYQAEALFSRHVKFDKRLLAVTLARINVRIFRYTPLMKQYPCGQVLSWRFTMEDKALHHFGSAGSTPEELAELARRRTDILLAPLQGHTNICRLAADYVRTLKPRTVIPHHQDDFYPPISRMVDIRPFIEMVQHALPDTEIKTMDINQTLEY